MPKRYLKIKRTITPLLILVIEFSGAISRRRVEKPMKRFSFGPVVNNRHIDQHTLRHPTSLIEG